MAVKLFSPKKSCIYVTHVVEVILSAYPPEDSPRNNYYGEPEY